MYAEKVRIAAAHTDYWQSHLEVHERNVYAERRQNERQTDEKLRLGIVEDRREEQSDGHGEHEDRNDDRDLKVMGQNGRS